MNSTTSNLEWSETTKHVWPRRWEVNYSGYTLEVKEGSQGWRFAVWLVGPSLFYQEGFSSREAAQRAALAKVKTYLGQPA